MEELDAVVVDGQIVHTRPQIAQRHGSACLVLNVGAKVLVRRLQGTRVVVGFFLSVRWCIFEEYQACSRVWGFIWKVSVPKSSFSHVSDDGRRSGKATTLKVEYRTVSVVHGGFKVAAEA
jgi:hypothetical protein